MSNLVTVEKFAIGQSVRRLEDPRLIQGFGRYSDDVSLPHQAYAVVVRSPHAHARIRSLDTANARGAPGVFAVLTGADLAADGLGDRNGPLSTSWCPGFKPPAHTKSYRGHSARGQCHTRERRDVVSVRGRPDEIVVRKWESSNTHDVISSADTH